MRVLPPVKTVNDVDDFVSAASKSLDYIDALIKTIQ